MTSLSTSGDGLIAALQMLNILAKSDAPASQVFQVFTPNFQKLKNLKGMEREILTRPSVTEALAKIEAGIDGKARTLVRPSGTESLIRVMVESADEALLDATMDEIILLLKKEAETSS